MIYKEKLDSGARLVRFPSIYSLFEYDDPVKYPDAIVNRNPEHHYKIDEYKRKRFIIDEKQRQIMLEAQKALKTDKDFLKLVYQGQSDKRFIQMNKFGGNLSVPHFATQNEKIFKRIPVGKKKPTLNIAFQVGTLEGYNYTDGFIKILKIVYMCQALGINLTIDMFDSDTRAISRRDSYVICNIINSQEKINFSKLLTCSHKGFFDISLFNGYSAYGEEVGYIGGFLTETRILQDLGDRYDVIGGNMLSKDMDKMVSSVIKIGLK